MEFLRLEQTDDGDLIIPFFIKGKTREDIVDILANLLAILSDDLLDLHIVGTPRSPRWTKVRNEVIEERGFCACCKSKKNLNVHHKKPFHLFPELELEKNNLIVLCATCHLFLGHLKNFKSWNPDVDKDVEMFRLKIERRPS